MEHKFKCCVCKQDKTHTNEHTTGYAQKPNGHKVCFACCAILDQAKMKKTGKAVLYLTNDVNLFDAKVTNWPGTLSIPIISRSTGRHNLTGTVYNVWFKFNGYIWHGRQFGDNTQLCHCKQTKREKL